MIEYDGKALLLKTLNRAGFTTLQHAISEMSLFANPECAQTLKNKNVFRVIRGASPARGDIVKYDDQYKKVMICDNTTPADAFQWIGLDIDFGNDIQCNHIYKDAQNVDYYTSLANICYTPTFLAKLTDTDKAVQQLLRYRVFDLYGFLPEGEANPTKPDGYDLLKWRDFPKRVTDVEHTYRARMANCPRRRATRSAAEIGWYFSDYQPDAKLISNSRAA